ncbi:MAG: alpha-amylase family glycosyl hydrolase [Muribaculum sp.]|nr:alpha-amylase family glycosyl hydrolase [Muribaculum sp.]
MTRHLSLLVAVIMAAVSFLPGVASSYRDARGVDNKVVYSVYLRNYTNPKAAATFSDLRRDIPRLKKLGVDVIHLLPFYEMGIEHAKGSPYCIRNYREVDSRYGSKEDLRALVDELHANGMQIWFDWVGNHTAYDHPWVKEHPDWYTERQDFDDVRSVNSASPELRAAMAEDMKYWVDLLGIDGFRCDFAHAPGKDFWVDVINRVDPGHNLFWLAEGNEYGIKGDWLRAEGGPFDSRYGWSFSEFMYEDRYARKDQTSTGDFGKAMFHLAYPQDQASFLTYLGSHDIFQGMLPQVSPNTQDVIYGDNLKPFTVMTMLAPGIPMIYMGQEINYSKPGGVGIMEDTEAVNWKKVDKDYQKLVKNLIELRHTQPALATFGGQLINHITDNDSVYVFERRIGDHSVVAAVNFSYNPQDFNITSAVIPANEYKEFFSGKYGSLASRTLSLPPKGYAVYIKDDQPLQAENYEIIVTLPEYSKTPLLSITAADPLHVAGDVRVVDPMEMTPVADQPGTFRAEVPYLPEFGYDIHVTNPSVNETLRLHCTTPRNHNIHLGVPSPKL